MIATLYIAESPEDRIGETQKILKSAGIDGNHPDLLYFPGDSKLGIEQVRKIKQHLSIKPYSAKGRVIVLEDASLLTVEAQNAILKTLEEPPPNAILILGATSESKLLPTILSRCEIVSIQSSKIKTGIEYAEDIEKLLKAGIEEKFEYVEKLKDREGFLKSLIRYFHSKLPEYANFTKELLRSEQWTSQNVSARAILEYLMLKMPGAHQQLNHL